MSAPSRRGPCIPAAGGRLGGIRLSASEGIAHEVRQLTRKGRSADPILAADAGEASGAEQSKQPAPGTSDVGTRSGPRAALREVMKGHPGAILQLLGPGLITGASDDDPSGIGTYAQVGSQFGFELPASAAHASVAGCGAP